MSKNKDYIFKTSDGGFIRIITIKQEINNDPKYIMCNDYCDDMSCVERTYSNCPINTTIELHIKCPDTVFSMFTLDTNITNTKTEYKEFIWTADLNELYRIAKEKSTEINNEYIKIIKEIIDLI